MNRIRSLSFETDQAVCEAGVILANLHEAAAKAGRRFPLSLGAKGSATIGGLISTNAGGTQVLRFGTMRGLVLGIEAVLPDGSIHDGLAALRKDNRGYDLRQLLIGAEGTLGVVTAATLQAGSGGGLALGRLDRPRLARKGARAAPAARGEHRRGGRELRAGAPNPRSIWFSPMCRARALRLPPATTGTFWSRRWRRWSRRLRRKR